ncbi:MAG: GGDEF domain-containing protein [Gammaproteobacteria bacterium]|nr:GGDEF domain-containing protein [Gammaproteobacteria bacterium]
MTTNLRKSSLVTILVTAMIIIALCAVSIWLLFVSGLSLNRLTMASAGTISVVSLIVWLNLRARRRWLEALDHDTEALAQMVGNEQHQSDQGRIQTVELAPLCKVVREERERLVHLGMTDYLSKAGNRRALEQWLRDFHLNPETGAPVSVLLIDIDHFKQINDSYGHKVGDRVIENFVHLLKNRVRGYDLIARLGGDEFCVVFPKTDLNIAASLAGRLRAQLPSVIELAENLYHPLSWTGGMSVTDPFDGAYDKVLWRADQALIRAKDSGRNQTKICRPSKIINSPAMQAAPELLH